MYITNGRIKNLEPDYPRDEKGNPIFHYWSKEDWDKAYEIARATWSELIGRWVYRNNAKWLLKHEESYKTEWCAHFLMKIISMDPYKAFTSIPYKNMGVVGETYPMSKGWWPEHIDWHTWADFCKWYLGYMKDFVLNPSGILFGSPDKEPIVVLTNDIIHGNPGRWYGQYALWRSGDENVLKRCVNVNLASPKWNGIRAYVDNKDYDLRECKYAGKEYLIPPRPPVDSELNEYIALITNPEWISSSFANNMYTSMNDSRKPFSGDTYVSTTRPEILADDDVELIQQGKGGINWYLIGISVALGAGLIYIAARR